MQTAEQYFMTVVEEQGISSAARKLFITQQSLSEQIRKLEQSCGAVLFLRRPRFQLTREGEAFYHTLQKIRVLEDGLQAELTEIRDKQRGRLNIGIHSARSRCILPETVARFRARYPNVVLNFFNHDTSDFEKMLLNGDLDLFFGVNARDLPEFHRVRIGSEAAYLVVSADYLRTALDRDPAEIGVIKRGDLLKMTLILSQQATNFRLRINEYLEGLDLPPEQVISVDGYHVQMELASHQVGACFCPQQMLRNAVLPRASRIAGRLLSFHIPEIADANELFVVTHRKAYVSEYKKAFIDLLVEECRKSMF
ncbi:MAG: LysR family transcriptional regulator [Stomatobaculum sp.]|nr:LysR family transcriptional regulator [Stomatobaculum sp.]